MTSAFNWPVRVYYEDTDAGGIVYYANYLRYFERARTEWLREIGVDQTDMRAEHNAIFVVKATAVEYHASARLDDALRITSVVEKIGRASIVFAQEAWCEERRLASAKVTICCVDVAQWRSIPLPSSVLAKINPSV